MGTVSGVIRGILELANHQQHEIPIWLVDDGSSDETATTAACAGATVIVHPTNRGKGAALLTGLPHCTAKASRPSSQQMPMVSTRGRST